MQNTVMYDACSLILQTLYDTTLSYHTTQIKSYILLRLQSYILLRSQSYSHYRPDYNGYVLIQELKTHLLTKSCKC